MPRLHNFMKSFLLLEKDSCLLMEIVGVIQSPYMKPFAGKDVFTLAKTVIVSQQRLDT